MKNLNKLSKTFLYLSALSGILWTGSYLLRLFITYQLFQEKDFLLKDYINEQNLDGILQTILPVFITTMVLYLIFIISFITFLITSKINLKQNGWLFIAALLVFITFPFEIFLMTIDYKVALLITQNSFNSTDVISLIIERFNALTSFPIIHILCYFAIIFLIIFKPLKIVSKQ